MAPYTIRHADTADLAKIYDIVYEFEVDDDANPPPRGAVPRNLRHEFAAGQMYVAEEAGQLVAFISLLTRSSTTCISRLLVRAGTPSFDLAEMLLGYALPKDASVCFASLARGPRALTPYVRAGMRPQWPSFLLMVDTSALGDLPDDKVEIVEAQPEDPEFLLWDRKFSGRDRSLEHRYWMQEEGGIPVWFRRYGVTVGYGYIRALAGAPWDRGNFVLGPIGAQTPDDALACVRAAANWSCLQAEILQVLVPGPHPCLVSLLNANFHIIDMQIFLSSSPDQLVDPQRYIPSGTVHF